MGGKKELLYWEGEQERKNDGVRDADSLSLYTVLVPFLTSLDAMPVLLNNITGIHRSST